MNIDILPRNVQSVLRCIVSNSGLQNYTIQVKSGSQGGDGLIAELTNIITKGLRNDVHGNGTEIELSLLCKLPPANENRREEFMCDILFRREIYFYTKLLPIFIDFQREKLVPDEDQFRAYAKCYAGLGVGEGGDYAIIMEDLRPTGFQMWNKAKPTTLANIRLVLEQIAKFHAISFAMKDQRPDEFAELKKRNDVLSNFAMSTSVRGFIDSSFERAKIFLRHDHHKKIISKIQVNFEDYYFSCLNESFHGDFAVVTHGDLWNNNIMYRSNENNEVEDVRFVDWQLIGYVSPAIDLIFHIFSATDKPLRDAEYMNLLQHYHNSLSQMIRKLSSDPGKVFTFDNLLDEMKKFGNYAFFLTPMVLSLSLADSSEIINLDDMCDQGTNVERNNKDLITGFSDEAQIEYENRLNDVIGDLVDMKYFKDLNI